MIRPAQLADAGQLAAIYNYYVIHSVATFALEPATERQMSEQIDTTPEQYPWLVLDIAGRIVGYAKLSQWKPREAYARTTEISVYIKHGEEGQGYGRLLYKALIEQARELGLHALLAGISLPNEASVKLHEKFGFEQVAHFKQTGHKFGHWVDVGYWQLILD